MGKKKQQQPLLDNISNLPLESILSCLKSRYETLKIYTNIGSRHLLVLNPLQELAINDDQTSLEYVAAYKDATSQLSKVDPHLFDLVNKVYFHMRRTGTDQNIVMR